MPGEETSSRYAPSIGSSPAASASSSRSEMRRDRSAQSSIVSWRVSGLSAITCSVWSSPRPNSRTRTSAKPSASASGAISRSSAGMSATCATFEHAPMPPEPGGSDL